MHVLILNEGGVFDGDREEEPKNLRLKTYFEIFFVILTT